MNNILIKICENFCIIEVYFIFNNSFINLDVF